MIGNRFYTQKITEESLFWGEFEEEANKFGIPWWCDLRRATKLSKIVCGWMYDPKIEKIFRGNCKNKLIEIGSCIKGRALDIGCGGGWLSLELARKGMNVDSVEISAKRIEIAKEYLKNNPFKESFGSINYRIEDINKIKLEKAEYQSVVSWDTLHHIPTVDRVVREIYESLKPNAYFVIYDHIGLGKVNQLLIKIFRSPLFILSKARKLFKRVKLNTRETTSNQLRKVTASPFEDVTGEEMVKVIKEYFKIETLETHLSFVSVLANDLLNLPDIIKYRCLDILKFIDNLLIKMHILRGEYVFIVARKKE